jgi:uncharacterized repeat protein (TIGR01451 family)/LPXTG-motif cell wall-anchored protein
VTWRRKAAAIVGAVALTISGLASTAGVLPGSAAPAVAVPGTPGTPQAPTVVFDENFNNRADLTPIVRLDQYVGATGQTYTAEQEWLTFCNGWISAFAQPEAPAAQVADCNTAAGQGGQNSWNSTQQLSWALGAYRGAARPDYNFAVSAYTANNPGADRVEFATATPVTLPAATGRFVTFSVDVAAVNCPPVASAPLLDFSLVDGGGTATPVGDTINPCSTGQAIQVPARGIFPARVANVGNYTSNGSVLLDGATFGIQMTNGQGSGGGNDHAFDNLRVLDVTPQLDKSFEDASIVRGETTTLTFTVTNTSELAAKNGWSFTDALPAGMTVAGAATTTCPAGVVDAPVGGSSIAVTGNLAAGQAACTISVDVLPDSVGSFTNGPDNVTETGLNPPGETTLIVEEQDPELTLVKSSDAGADPIVVDQVVTYSFLVTNTGNIRVEDIVITDEEFTGAGELGPITCPAGAASLAVDASITCTADYTITQADVDAGQVDNTATATGTPPAGEPTTSNESSTSAPSDPAPALSIEKSADTQGPVDLGDEIVYSFVVTNTGNVTVSDIAVDDDRLTAAGIAVTCEAATLAPDASTTCVADEPYAVTEADLLDGDVDNTASGTGTPPSGPSIESPPDTVTVPTVDIAPALTIEKSADTEGPVDFGDEIVYSFVVTNTGNVTVSDVAVDDDRLAAAGIAVTCEAATLAPEASTTCVADEPYAVTEADVLAGAVDNTATGTGTDPNEGPVESTPDTATVPTAEVAPSIVIDKSAEHDDANGNGAIDVGEEILFSFAVSNTGNVTVSDIAIDDPMLAAAGIAVTCDPATVAPATTILCVADAPYVVTQADVDAEQVVNTATATGTPPVGPPVESPTDTTTTPGESLPGIGSLKSAELADSNGNQRADAGETIVFTVTVTNTGNVTLTDIVVDDPMIAVTCPQPVLAPGASMDCVSTPYTVTAADVARGEVLNTATVTGSTPGGDDLSSTTNTTRTPTALVAAPPVTVPGLPQTGTEVASAALVLLAMLLLAGGAALVARRRLG